ncbi:MAG: dihydrofolate reductase family protein [Candidatus Aenigmarchaeota archaeon]|nr:dihydrofolate reductase family protein [Candidatus Aenigmarchaeota archaeon]
MKVILFMSMSVNGIIAREDGSEDFLSDENWKVFCKLAKQMGCFVIGRKTYETVMRLYKNYNFDDVKAKKIVVSTSSNFSPAGYTVAKSPKDAIKKAKNVGFKQILLTGGSRLNSSFLKENLVDEIILNIEPAILGKGIKLFAEDAFERRLSLIKTTKLKSGIVQLHYKVKKVK